LEKKRRAIMLQTRGILEVAVENVDQVSPEEFALCRKNGLGASDSSVVLETMEKFRTPDMLLNEKIQKFWTPEEQEIGTKVNVMKGRDLEPLIREKAEEALHMVIFKPKDMYRIIEFPYLTINYDGVYFTSDDVCVPVECKFISTYGAKYYNFERAGDMPDIAETDVFALAAHVGIPPYYYVQVQHQLLGTKAPYGWLAALNDKDWKLYMFKVYANDYVQKRIIVEGYQFWQRVLKNS
jgi:predicted phage-related endonuclease